MQISYSGVFCSFFRRDSCFYLFGHVGVSVASHRVFTGWCGVFCCGAWTLAAACRLTCCGAWAQLLCRTGDPSSPTRDGTHIPCIARQIPNLRTTREAPHFLNSVFSRAKVFYFGEIQFRDFLLWIMFWFCMRNSVPNPRSGDLFSCILYWKELQC